MVCGTKNILFVVSGLLADGLEAYLVSMLLAIDRERFKVTIVCTNRRDKNILIRVMI